MDTIKDQIFYHPIIEDNKWFTTLDDNYLSGGERSPKSRIQQINTFLDCLKQEDRPNTLLDIGCNIGLFCHYYAEIYSLECTGVENNSHNKLKNWASFDNIKLANTLSERYLSLDSPYPRFINDDYLSLCRRENFDIVLYLSVWHHHMRSTYNSKVSKEEALEYLYTVIDCANKYIIFEHDNKSGVNIEEVKTLINEKYGDSIEIISHSPVFDVSSKNNYVFNRHLLIIKKKRNILDRKLTICVTTLLRQKSLDRCISSIICRYPEHQILIGNSSPNPILKHKWGENVKMLHLPPYCGLSACRNTLVNHVTTPFFMLLEDDMYFTDETDLDVLVEQMLETDYDMIGLTLNDKKSGLRHWSGNFDFKNGFLTTTTCNVETGGYVDSILNVFIARTEKVKQHLWDPRLKVYEHTIFFYDNWVSNNSMNITVNNDIIINHDHDSEDSEYNSLRKPPMDYLYDAMHRRGIYKMKTQGGTIYNSKKYVSYPDTRQLVKSEIIKSVHNGVINKLDIMMDPEYIWLPRKQRDFTKNHVYGTEVQRQCYLLSGEILDKLISLSRSDNYPKNLLKIVDYDDNHIICERIDGMVLCNKSQFTPLSDKLKPCYFDYDTKIHSIDLLTPITELHKLGLCHTDITEFNYMVNRDGRVYLIDLLSIVPFSSKYAGLDYECYNKMMLRLDQRYKKQIIS